MTRTLPWLRKPDISTKDTRYNTLKRQKVTHVKSDDGIARPARKLATYDRTPSTSPPPEPPEEEFMREGLDYDDIYIMVEDEFQAVARMFTQHLHHAEYRRLKDLAKAQNASTIQSILRPVDSRTMMRRETMKKIQAEKKHRDMKTTVQGVLSATDANREGEVDSDFDVNEEDDPWVGTSLQDLMMSPRKSQSSLIHVAGAKSGSRAAAGFAKANSTPLQRATINRVAENKKRSLPGSHQLRTFDESSTTGDDDDLDAPILKTVAVKTVAEPVEASRAFQTTLPPFSEPGIIEEGISASISRRKRPTAREFEKITRSGPAQASSLHTSTGVRTSQTVSNSGMPNSSTIDQSLQDLPSATVIRQEIPQRADRRLAELKAQRAKKEEKQKHKTTTLNEIPTFLF